VKQRVVVTGMGVLAPNGKTLDEFWQANVNGVSGIDYISLFDIKDFDIKIGGEVKNFDPAQYILPSIYRKIDRFAQLGVCAAKMAIDDAALSIDETNNSRVGVIVGTGLGGILFHEEQIISVIQNGGPSKIMASSVPESHLIPSRVTSQLHLGSRASTTPSQPLVLQERMRLVKH